MSGHVLCRPLVTCKHKNNSYIHSYYATQYAALQLNMQLHSYYTGYVKFGTILYGQGDTPGSCYPQQHSDSGLLMFVVEILKQLVVHERGKVTSETQSQEEPGMLGGGARVRGGGVVRLGAGGGRGRDGGGGTVGEDPGGVQRLDYGAR